MLEFGLRLALVLSASLGVTSCGTSEDPNSADAKQRWARTAVEAVFADGRLWVRNVDGSLAALEPERGDPLFVSLTGKATAICKRDGHLLFVAQDDRNRRWILRSYSSGGWTAPLALPTEGDSLVALACDSGPVALVTSRRLIEVAGRDARAVRLSEPLRPPLIKGTSFATAAALWLGFNAGEWGGGLMRVDRATGRIDRVDSNVSGELCGGPLNTQCDPVNGIVASPWKSSCIVAAIGVVHFSPDGRIVQVCGRSVRRLYFRAFGKQPPHNRIDQGEPSNTVAFFGLARAGDVLWAIGIDGLYRFAHDGRVQIRPLPTFEKRGAYRVSFAEPGIALVMTGINARASVSGSVPIMAIR